MHKPVLLKETIYYLDPKPNENFIDATYGLGGCAQELLKHILPNGKILALEWDPILVEIGQKKLMNNRNIILRNSNFKHIKKIVKEENFTNIKGIIFDLGISSWHLEKSKRGFSFKKDEFLDMRINPYEVKITAFDVINYSSKEKLIEIFQKYGEERSSEKIAQAIIKKRKESKIETSKELAEVIASIIPRRKKIHPATQVFMALRMFINQELENLKKGLKDSYEVLNNRGRIVVITFNGLEDKVVKQVFKELKKKGAKMLTKKVIRPQKRELIDNLRARSAKLRAILKDENENKKSK